MEIFTTKSSFETSFANGSSPATQKEAKTKKDRVRMGIAIAGFILSVGIIILGALLGAEAKKHKGDDNKVRREDAIGRGRR